MGRGVSVHEQGRVSILEQPQVSSLRAFWSGQMGSNCSVLDESQCEGSSTIMRLYEFHQYGLPFMRLESLMLSLEFCFQVEIRKTRVGMNMKWISCNGRSW